MIPISAARRFACRSVGLEQPFAGVAEAIAHHGYIQIDPINVCGRMHDLILRNRVAGYREGDLMRHLHGSGQPLAAEERTGFEHYLPGAGILTAFGLEAWPHLLAEMRRRPERESAWSGGLTEEEANLVEPLLAEMRECGPISSAQVKEPGASRTVVWGSATVAKSALQKLCFHGKVMIARREGGRRLYDLTERVIPAAVLALPEPSAAETVRWLAMTKMKQRRLVFLKREELKSLADDVLSLKLEGADAPVMHCLRRDLPLLEECLEDREDLPETSRLLAPLDPLIYDRRMTSALWGFDYTWEVYTPPQKRMRGYYALPVLSRRELVGHVDPKADAKAKKLTVVSKSVKRGHSVAPQVKALAKFLGLK